MARTVAARPIDSGGKRSLVPLIVREGEEPVWVEVEDGGDDPSQWVFAAAPKEADVEPPKTVDEALGRIKPLVESLFERLSSVAKPPKEIQLKLSLKVSGKVGVFVAESTGEGAMEVTLKWSS
jgi:hypothetical protein